MKASVTHTKEAFQDELRKTTVEKCKKNDDEEEVFEELWKRFWEPFEKTEFEKCEWMRIKNVWKPNAKKIDREGTA